MRSYGIVRRLDDLGRLVIPKELRDQFGFHFNDFLELKIDGAFIYLERYQPRCVFCKGIGISVVRDGKPICKKCMDDIKRL